MSRPLVRDAADPKEHREAKQKEMSTEERARRDLSIILAMPEGRRIFWSLLDEAGLFESIWANSALIHYNCGRQDFGRAILAKIINADEKFYFQMMSENRKDNQ